MDTIAVWKKFDRVLTFGYAERDDCVTRRAWWFWLWRVKRLQAGIRVYGYYLIYQWRHV